MPWKTNSAPWPSTSKSVTRTAGRRSAAGRRRCWTGTGTVPSPCRPEVVAPRRETRRFVPASRAVARRRGQTGSRPPLCRGGRRTPALQLVNWFHRFEPGVLHPRQEKAFVLRTGEGPAFCPRTYVLPSRGFTPPGSGRSISRSCRTGTRAVRPCCKGCTPGRRPRRSARSTGESTCAEETTTVSPTIWRPPHELAVRAGDLEARQRLAIFGNEAAARWSNVRCAAPPVTVMAL